MSYGNGWSTKREHQEIAKWLGWEDLADDQMRATHKTLWKNEHGRLEPHCRNYDYDCESVYLLTFLKEKGYYVSLQTEYDVWALRVDKDGLHLCAKSKDLSECIQDIIFQLIRSSQ